MGNLDLSLTIESYDNSLSQVINEMNSLLRNPEYQSNYLRLSMKRDRIIALKRAAEEQLTSNIS